MMRFLAVPAVALALAFAAAPARASNFYLDQIQNLTQDEFHQLSQDLAAATSFKPYEPAAALGPLGFDVGVALTGTVMANSGVLQKAVSNGTAFSTLPVPTLRATKGLPFNVDVGAEYSRIPDSGITLYGAQIKWAFVPGDIALPAIAIRGDVTRIDGISQLGFETLGADISISKGILLATPYAGAGVVYARSATDGLALQQVNITQSKVFAGVDINLGLGDLVIEADTTGNVRSYGAKLGMRF